MKHINTVKAMVSFLVLSLFCFIFSPVWAENQTVTLNTDTNPGGGGTSGDLRYAIDNVGAGETITFNLSSGNETITLSSQLSIEKNLTNKDRLCEQSEPQSYPVVGQARHVERGLNISKYLF